MRLDDCGRHWAPAAKSVLDGAFFGAAVAWKAVAVVAPFPIAYEAISAAHKRGTVARGAGAAKSELDAAILTTAIAITEVCVVTGLVALDPSIGTHRARTVGTTLGTWGIRIGGAVVAAFVKVPDPIATAPWGAVRAALRIGEVGVFEAQIALFVAGDPSITTNVARLGGRSGLGDTLG